MAGSAGFPSLAYQRKNEPSASVRKKTKIMSGKTMRVNKNIPTENAADSPAAKPAEVPAVRFPMKKRIMAVPSTARADGSRAANSVTPNKRYETPISQYIMGGLSKKRTPLA